jgi:hypothetical protein
MLAYEMMFHDRQQLLVPGSQELVKLFCKLILDYIVNVFSKIVLNYLGLY